MRIWFFCLVAFIQACVSMPPPPPGPVVPPPAPPPGVGGLEKVICHRAGAGLATENSLEALERCIEVGADGAEIDVRLVPECHGQGSKVLVYHDNYLDRLTEGEGYLSGACFDELRRLRLKPNERQAHARPQQIPTLDEMLALVAGSDFVMDIEIKRDDCHPGVGFELEQEVLGAIERFRIAPSQVVLTSFCPLTVDWFGQRTISWSGQLLPASQEAITSALGKDPWSRVDGFVVWDRSLSPSALEELPNDKLWVYVMPVGDALHTTTSKLRSFFGTSLGHVTVPDPDVEVAAMCDLLDLGLGGIITNHPELLIKLKRDPAYRARVCSP